ncbi:hypothetical protein CN878_16840 [Ochrobactrum sp. 695/2009]|nr:hypothetical protein CN881_19445 [Ochrobactrum sp. 721/2009]PJT16717.1 hypothetical protein CN880_10310 [Ochrobactrum sp. 720/2009]PJT26539.1 hypothetical protein CN879_06275 [Ochrobactrum sp. 715/2009]PJT28645.1 hypothetical protein CN878_16840 [Ochrobactrum sp. 695/2009]PJT36059.1 hypothetical protein CN877_08720 [Ochrobactrum sp. 689/2009]
MHPSIQNTYNEVAKTLIGLTVKAEKPLTFGEVCKKIERGAHTRISLEVLAGIMPEWTFESAMARLDRVIERQAEAGKVKHWTYNQCRHLALIEHREKLLAFEAGRRGYLEAAE